MVCLPCIDDLLLQEDLIQMLPMVSEANAMAEELHKGVKFEINLVSPQARGQKNGKTEVMVKMLAQDGSGNDWLWDRNKFINRKYIMQEMYANFVDGDENWDLPQEKDPFWEPADCEKLIGTCHVLLQSLAYNIDLQEKLVISDFKGQDQGHVDIAIVPCTKDYKPVGEDEFVEDPKELLGKPLFCIVKITAAQGLPQNIAKSFCRYKFYLDKDYVQTNEISGTINPEFNHEKQVTIKSVTEQFIEYLNNESLYIEVWGRQKAGKGQKEKTMVGKGGKQAAPAAPVGGVAVNGQAGGTALTPIPDTKSKEEAAKYRQEADSQKKRAEESDAKLSKINGYMRERKNKGHTAIKIEDVEALLAGKIPKGEPVQPTVVQVEGGSKACTIQ
ncbi:hypothetical protein DPMN_063377 [Dreissena polymorpha]|uniref:Uncharacterized protein n=1 Tax=Dreissena polymorpha TaxID=45954 RepID=A0A9D4CBJ6_DREPO|nr:hypothetical protein DPMN_063377 [Dreissena polymorpha]